MNAMGAYPYFKDSAAARLSREGCKIKDPSIKHKTFTVSGSGYLFLKELTGLNSITDISRNVSLELGQDQSLLYTDLCELIDGLAGKGLVAISPVPVNHNKPFLTHIAPRLRDSLHFDITHRCNEKCIHCLADKDSDEPATVKILEILSEAARLGFTELSLSGGEPLIHPDFAKIFESARGLGFAVTIFSNGLAWTDSLINLVSTIGVDEVRISLYSLRAEIHDAITKTPGSFIRTVATIKTLRERNIPVYINAPIMPMNFAEYQAIAEFAKAHNCRFNLDTMIQPARDGRCDNADLHITYPQEKEVIAYQQTGELEHNVKKDIAVCMVGSRNGLYVDANLNVYPCPGLRFKIGNASKQSLEEALSHKIFDELQQLNLQTLQTCTKCDVREGCNRCHGRAYRDTGDYTKCSSVDRNLARIRAEIISERRQGK